MSDVPQTRYDLLYGTNNPNIPKVGIRRHLNAEYVGREDQANKDASVVRNSLQSARRVRQKVEAARTHRNITQQ